MVGDGVAWIEPFSGKVGYFKGVARGGQARAHLGGHTVGERLRVVMSNYDQCVHDFDSI